LTVTFETYNAFGKKYERTGISLAIGRATGNNNAMPSHLIKSHSFLRSPYIDS